MLTQNGWSCGIWIDNGTKKNGRLECKETKLSNVDTIGTARYGEIRVDDGDVSAGTSTIDALLTPFAFQCFQIWWRFDNPREAWPSTIPHIKIDGLPVSLDMDAILIGKEDRHPRGYTRRKERSAWVHRSLSAVRQRPGQEGTPPQVFRVLQFTKREVQGKLSAFHR
jgi:hypothetical protein